MTTHRSLLTPGFHFKVLKNFVDMFNRKRKIVVENFSCLVNGPEFDVTPYMNLCALDNISGECRALKPVEDEDLNDIFLDILSITEPHQKGNFGHCRRNRGRVN